MRRFSLDISRVFGNEATELPVVSEIIAAGEIFFRKSGIDTFGDSVFIRHRAFVTGSSKYLIGKNYFARSVDADGFNRYGNGLHDIFLNRIGHLRDRRCHNAKQYRFDGRRKIFFDRRVDSHRDFFNQLVFLPRDDARGQKYC